MNHSKRWLGSVGAALAVAAMAGPMGMSGDGAAGGGKTKPAAGDATAVQVRFVNGSVVVMTVLQANLEIATAYGKLTVPMRDVRRIEFGVQLSDREKRKLDEAIDRLTKGSTADQQAATRTLIALGPKAYPRLQQTAAAADEALATRVQSVIDAIRAKHPARLLRSRDKDVVRTPEFTVVGHIITPVLKARAENLGTLDLHPARLLTLQSRADDGQKKILVDAASYAALGVPRWLATGVRVQANAPLHITATGKVDQWPQQPGQYVCGPDGNAAGAMKGGMVVINGRVMRRGAGGMVGGELIGRIGENGTPFVIGSRFDKSAKSSGQLYLRIAPSPWNCPSTGEYRVTLTPGAIGEANDEN